MDYLWLGMLLDDADFQEVGKKGWHNVSQQQSQKMLFVGLEQNLGQPISIINSCTFPSYPRYNDFIVKAKRWSHREGVLNYNIGFLNIKYINHLSRSLSVAIAAKKWAKKYKNRDVTIFVYSMNYPLLNAAVRLKKLNASVKIVLIVPDLPIYMDLSATRLKRIMKYFDWKFGLKWLLYYVDKFVLYSRPMADFLDLPLDKWIVMEGAVDDKYDFTIVADHNQKSTQEDNEREIIFMYSGSVDKNYGILEALKAFSMIEDERCRLWIAGDGNCVKEVLAYAKADHRVRYLGYISNANELDQLQQQADALMNLRDPKQALSKYAFPSKILTYMAAAKPVLSCSLGGVPREYDSYLTLLDDLSPDSIKKGMLLICEMGMSERWKIGQRCKKFVLENKNYISQTNRIIEFCKTF